MPAAVSEKGRRNKGETRRQYNIRFGNGDKNPPETELPEGTDHLWQWFWNLSKRRRAGPEHISYGDIGEWVRLTETLIDPEEIEVLIAMDDAWMRGVREDQVRAETESAGYTTTDGAGKGKGKAARGR
jgi:hypothetical protein